MLLDNLYPYGYNGDVPITRISVNSGICHVFPIDPKLPEHLWHNSGSLAFNR